MVRLLLLLALVGLSQAHVCSIDEECDPPQVCTAPPLKWGSCVDPSRKLLLSDPDRINCLDGSACPADQKCFRVMGSPIGVCVPKESPPDSEPARNCVQSSQCKSSERCYRPAGTPIGVCVPGESHKLLPPPVLDQCESDEHCARDEVCRRTYPGHLKCFKKPRSLAGDECYFHDSCLDGQFCDNGKCYDEVTGQPVKRRLIPMPKCFDNGHCGPTAKCVRGRCVLAGMAQPNKFVAFDFSANCQGSDSLGICPTDTHCVRGRCISYRYH